MRRRDLVVDSTQLRLLAAGWDRAIRLFTYVNELRIDWQCGTHTAAVECGICWLWDVVVGMRSECKRVAGVKIRQ